MPSPSKPSSSGRTVFVLGFVVILGFFLDAVWVLGQKAWMHAFGVRTEGLIVATHSYGKGANPHAAECFRAPVGGREEEAEEEAEPRLSPRVGTGFTASRRLAGRAPGAARSVRT